MSFLSSTSTQSDENPPLFLASKDQVKALQEAFSFFDKNQDGRITIRELRALMKSLGHNPTEEELQDIINKVDTDDSGTMECDEFLLVMSTRMNHLVDIEHELIEAFKVFDRNGNGLVSGEEVRHVMTYLGEEISNEDIDEIIAQHLLDKNGELNYENVVKEMIEE